MKCRLPVSVPLRRAQTALAAVAFLLGSTPSRADDTSDLRGLLEETVVTTASKAAQTGTDAPATSTTLSSDEMYRYGIHTLDEAIAFLSLGASASNPLHTPDVGARGVTIDGDLGNHFLLLVDGHTMNEAGYGLARFGRGLGVPFDLVDHIEMILGPGAVLYGTGAMLGVINVVTKRARDLQGVYVVAESELTTSYRGGVGFGFPFKLLGSAGEIVAGAELFTSNGPYLKFGPQNAGISPYTGLPWDFERGTAPTGIWGGRETRNLPFSDAPAGYMTVRLGDFTLHVQASTFKVAAPYRARRVQDNSDFDDPGTFQIDRSLRGDLSWQKSVSQVLSINARLYGDTFDYRDFFPATEALTCARFYPGTRTCRYTGLTTSQWAGLELQGSFNWSRDGSNVTLVGVDGRIRHVRGKDDVFDYDTDRLLDVSSDVIAADTSLLGIYAQHAWQPSPVFGLNAGARGDYDPRFDPVISPRLALTVKPWEGGSLKAIYAEAFRAPSFRETETSDIIQLRAENLVPETTRSVEGSIEQKFGSHRIFFGAFRSWWSNMVEPHLMTPEEKTAAVLAGKIDFNVSAGAVIQYRNVASIDNYGFNGAYEGNAVDGRLRFGTNITGAIATHIVGASELPITLAPRIFGNARVSYDLRGYFPVVAVAGHFTGLRIADRAWDGGFAVYPVAPPQCELRATLSGAIPMMAGLSYRVSANFVIGDRGPYVVGFAQGGNDFTRDVGELVPTDTFRTTVALRYESPK